MTKKSKARAKAEPTYIGVSTRIPEALWERVKLHCVKAKVTIQEYVINLLDKATKK